MLKSALIFTVVVAIAGILGFGGLAGVALGFTKLLLFAALACAALLLALVFVPTRRARR